MAGSVSQAAACAMRARPRVPALLGTSSRLTHQPAPLASALEARTWSSKAAPTEMELRRREELKARQDEMAAMMREQTMREVSRTAADVRPDGISHVLTPSDDPVKRLAEIRDANRDAEDGAEWGGPKGAC